MISALELKNTSKRTPLTQAVRLLIPKSSFLMTMAEMETPKWAARFWSRFILLLLVGGAKVTRIMKKRNNFFQVFLFSLILQGFHGEKIVAFF